MIERYAREEMRSVWANPARYRVFLDIELYACEAMAKLGHVPAGVPELLRERAGSLSFDEAAIGEIEGRTRHDFVAFMDYVVLQLGPEARYLHRGLTTSDVQDAALSVLIRRSGEILVRALDRLMAALKKQAIAHRYTICVGRTHGVHAEPTTFGLKMAVAYAEFVRHKKRIQNALEEVSVCALSGAVGTYAHVDPFVEAYVAEKLGLKPECISTQVIPRDRYAVYFARLAIAAGSIERLATEIRSLQRTEIGEVEEDFGEGQKGSSAMPHKRNPVLSENLVGLSRMMRSMAVPILENVALWHERDISHSSVERVFFPDANMLADFALARLADIIENLKVYPARMARNLDMLGGLIYSQRVLLALVDAGLSREDAYGIVQRCAKPVWDMPADQRRPDAFLCHLREDRQVVAAVSGEELAAIFNPGDYLRHVDTIYGRVFQEDGARLE